MTVDSLIIVPCCHNTRTKKAFFGVVSLKGRGENKNTEDIGNKGKSFVESFCIVVRDNGNNSPRAFSCFDESLKGYWGKGDISIEKNKHIPRGSEVTIPESPVFPRPSVGEFRVVDNMRPIVFGYFSGSVGGKIVDNNDFMRRECLFCEGTENLRKIGLFISGWNDCRDFGWCFEMASFII